MEQNQDNKMIYRRFELLKPDQEEDLQNLVAEKNLTREDLILICSTLSLKEEPEHTANVNELENIAANLDLLLKIQCAFAVLQGLDVVQLLSKDLTEICAELSELQNRHHHSISKSGRG